MKSAETILLFILFLFSSCSDFIEYSPFDTNVRSEYLNKDHILRIVNNNPVNDTLKFAVFSDVHEDYDAMSDAIRDINSRKDVSFIICNGDITNGGLAQEFKWYAGVIPESEIPLVTVIGNHDCLANGLLIFGRMFGSPDTSFVTGKYKFILFNNIIWENNNSSPNYEWLRNQVRGGLINIVISHIPPISADIGSLHRIIYNGIVDSTNTAFAIHSSAHRYREYRYYGINTIITNTVKKREYCIIEAYNNEFNVKRVNF